MDSLIWRVRVGADTADVGAPGEGAVPVDRVSLAVILDLAEVGLAHADQATLTSAGAAVEQIRVLLTNGAEETGSDRAQGTEGEEN